MVPFRRDGDGIVVPFQPILSEYTGKTCCAMLVDVPRPNEM
jgi:hypothetical protein